MNKIKVYNVPLKDICVQQLNKRGIHVPKDAVKCENFCIQTNERTVDVYSFYNNKKNVVKRVKEVEDMHTKDKTLQVRYYGYAPTKDNKRKRHLSEVNQYTFDSKRNCTNGEHWHFYYPKFETKVRFANSGTNGEKNNFIKSNDFVVDKNGIVIKPISIAEYLENKRKLGKQNFIDSPWTTSESITGESVATDSIAECTAVGIIGKKGISLNHFSPAEKKNQEIGAIENKLVEELKEQGEAPKVFMIGSSESDKGSNAQFELIDNFFVKQNIPHSKYKTGDRVLYSSMPSLTYLNNYDLFAAFGFYSHNKAHTIFYDKTGQHILYKDGKLLLANPIIDRELINGNNDPLDLIKKSFGHISE